MTLKTRATNKDADFKVFYSNKVPKPQQRYFPHRKKTVREKPGTKDAAEPRQMKFLPEMMRRTGTVQDSENEEDGIDEGGIEVEVKEEVVSPRLQTTKRKVEKTKGKKRSSETVEEEDGESVRPARKRRRTLLTAAHARECAAEIQVASSSESEQEEQRKRKRRQSTMTQLVDGRKPPPGIKEPEFKPIKRGSRVSWGKGNEQKKKDKKDKQQRTLTQMVPGLVPLGIVSDDDIDWGALDDKDWDALEDQEAVAYHDEMAELLKGIFEPAEKKAKGQASVRPLLHDRGLSVDAKEGFSRTLLEHNTLEVDADEGRAAEYEPTQDVCASALKTRRKSKRLPGNIQRPFAGVANPTAREPTRVGFSQLSTPERRRVRVIPSSQSPPDSPISTRFISPINSARRMTLGERSGNLDRPLDTPSKLRKVIFQEPAEEPIPAPPTLRTFKSVIQDSEDEDEGLSEDEIESVVGQPIGAQTQSLISGIGLPVCAVSVGAETQAVLQQIDQACANAEEDAAVYSRESSEELGAPMPDSTHREASEELGQEPLMEDVIDEELASPEPEAATYPSSPPVAKPEPVHKEDVARVRLLPGSASQEPFHGEDVSMFSADSGSVLQEPTHEGNISTTSPPPGSAVDGLPFLITHVTKNEHGSEDERVNDSLHVQNATLDGLVDPSDDLPSTPMIINDSDDEEDAAPTPQPLPSQLLIATPSSVHDSLTDLDGKPIQVPCSPTPKRESQRSYTSHSSKAEKQIQTEWLTNTQYFRARNPPSSSMHGVNDHFSYQATPLPNATREMAPPQSTATALFSQATTVDCTQASPHTSPKKPRPQSRPILSAKSTPKKPTHHPQPIPSAHTTPRKHTSSLRDFVSPVRPPTLVIPSSFPSPGRAGMQEWSSPVMERTQFGGTQGVEDFSMPPLPPFPVSSDYGDDDEEL